MFFPVKNKLELFFIKIDKKSICVVDDFDKILYIYYQW